MVRVPNPNAIPRDEAEKGAGQGLITPPGNVQVPGRLPRSPLLCFLDLLVATSSHICPTSVGLDL